MYYPKPRNQYWVADHYKNGHVPQIARGHYHVNDWWISLMQINAWHTTISTPMKKSNLELIWNKYRLILHVHLYMHYSLMGKMRLPFIDSDFYTPIFKTGRIMVYQCPSVHPFHMSHSNLRTPWPIHFKFQSYWNWWSYGLYTLWWNFEFSFQSYGPLFIKL